MSFWFSLPLSTLLIFPRSSRLQIQMQIFYLLLFYVLFGLRFIVLIRLGLEVNLGRVVQSIETLKSTFFLFSLGTFLIIFTSSLLLQHFNIPRNVTENFDAWLDSKSSKSLFLLFFLLSFFGFSLMFLQLGSFPAMFNTFFFHQKQGFEGLNSFNIGVTLWSTFSIPALVITIMRFAKRPKFVELLALGLLLAPMLFIFGSRLSLFVSIVASFYLLSLTNYGFRAAHLFSALVIFISASLPILARREVRTSLGTLLEIVSDKLSYPVIDATTILYANPEVMRVQVLSLHRIFALFSSLVPRFIWPNKPSLDNSLLDNTMARNFGFDIQAQKSGWPTGFITEGFAIAGNLGVIVSAVAIGVIAYFLLRIQSNSFQFRPEFYFVKSYVIVFFLIAVYKDGDSLASFVGSLKTAVWLSFTIAFMRFLTRQREQ